VPALKIAVQLAALRMPLRKALHTAAQLRASAVEIDARRELRPSQLTATGLRELRNLLDELNLRVAVVSFPTERGYDVEDRLDQRVAATKAAMKMAYELGARVVVNQVGAIPDAAEGQRWNTLLQVLTDLGNYGHHVGALFAAQMGAESGADLARLLAALPADAIGVDLDPGALIVNGFSPLEAIGDLGRQIIHVHARDGVRDLARKRGLEVPLGRGSADFPAILAALEERGYSGYFTVARDHADDPEHELGSAIQYLRNI
jgi:sugar phosphate isomerase/epimerase